MFSFAEEPCIHRLRSPEREDAVHSRELRIEFPSEVLSLEIEQGASPCLLEDFGRVCGRILVVSIQPQRRALEDSVDPQGGDFRGLAISETLSGLSGFGE